MGQVDALDVSDGVDHWKAAGLDLSPILYQPPLASDAVRYCREQQDHGLEHALDQTLIQLAEGSLKPRLAVDVRPTSEPSFSESIFGDVNPVLGSIGALLGISIILALLVMARNATVRRGSKSEYEWDEYSDYLDEDEDDYIDDDADLNLNQPIKENTPVETAGAQATTSTQATSTDGWTKGSDGVWWWQNQEDGSWWYKDANGEILQYK